MKGTINSKNFGEFKKLYNKAVEEKKEIFIFEGNEIVTNYAKYVIEYAEMQETEYKKRNN